MIVEHVGITVSDLDTSIRYYTEVFDFCVLRKTTSNAYLHLENDLLELMQRTAPATEERPQTPETWHDHMKATVGLVHVGFRVDDIDEALERIKRLGGNVIAPPVDYEPQIEYVADPTEDKLKRAARPVAKLYWRIAMVSDPDGVILEILER